jgi:hypothetical protein
LRNVLQGLQMRETNTSTAQQQSQYQAIEAKKANKTAEARKEKNKQERARQAGHSNPYANKPATEKVFYKNPNKVSEEKAPTRPKISLKKDPAKPVPAPKPESVSKPESAPKPETASKPADNGGFSWNKPD